MAKREAKAPAAPLEAPSDSWRPHSLAATPLPPPPATPARAPLAISEYRDLAVELLLHWVNGAAGRDEADSVYKRVTEGRDVGSAQATYSSCGDLAHCLLHSLGVRLPFVNHGAQWRVGRNVAALAWASVSNGGHTEPLAHPVALGWHGEPGDIVIAWRRGDTTDAHVMCVVEHNARDEQGQGVLLAAEYGQPGGKLRTHGIERRAVPPELRASLSGNPREALFIADNSRVIARALSLAEVLEAAQRQGKLEDIDGPALLAAWGVA